MEYIRQALVHIAVRGFLIQFLPPTGWEDPQYDKPSLKTP